MSQGKLPSILVVDDNHDNAEIIRQYLEIRGYPIAVAHDGEEALVLFETVKPALVLLDIMMPGRDGWEVCRIMKQHPLLGKSVRIIMVTALDEWQDKREALQLGAVRIKRRLSRIATASANSRFMVEESRVTREGYAAVDHYRLPGDLRGGLGAEKEHEVRDILGLRYSPQGGEPLEGYSSRPRNFPEVPRVDQPRCHRVDVDPVPPPAQSEASGESHEARLRRVVVREIVLGYESVD